MMQWLGSLQIHEFHQTQHRIEMAQAQKNTGTEKKEEEEERSEGQEKPEQKPEQEKPEQEKPEQKGRKEQLDMEEKTDIISADQSQATSSSTPRAGGMPLSQEHAECYHSPSN